MEILDGLVVPTADALVGGKFAQVVESTDVLGSTTVKTGDRSGSVRTVITGSGKAEIYTGNV